MGMLNSTTDPERTTPLTWWFLGLGVVSAVLTLGQLAEDSTLGGFYASRVALWNHGAYFPKLHLVLVWLTVFAFLATPVNVVHEIVVFVRELRRSSSTEPVSIPLGWDTQQRRRRITGALLALGLGLAWRGLPSPRSW